jgi:hypothetical protein
MYYKEQNVVINAGKAGRKEVQSLWAWSGLSELNRARENLRKREETPNVGNIGFLVVTDKAEHGRFPEIVQKIRGWAASREDIDAVIWTDLPSNFENVENREFNANNVISFLKNLNSQAKDKAEEYVREAPPQVMTNMRNIIKEKLGWTCLDEKQGSEDAT